jgi:hypothetical protein
VIYKTQKAQKEGVAMKKSVTVKIDLTPEINMAIVRRADQESKNFEDIIFEILEKEFESEIKALTKPTRRN